MDTALSSMSNEELMEMFYEFSGAILEGRQDHDLLMQVVYEMASRSPNGELTLKFPDDDEGPVEPLTFKIRKGSPGRQN